MSTSLLHIAIGPVQDFIASARRTRDLWFGSFLLSELSKTAARYLHEKEPNCLIFPAPINVRDLQPNDAEGLNVANVILAEIKAHPRNLAKGAEEAVRDRLTELLQEALAELTLPDHEKKRIAADAQKQVQDALEFYWASTPIGNGYVQARRRVVALLAARKATRDFSPVTWGSARCKSSLDGQRESLIPSKDDKNKGERTLYAKYRVHSGEFLSGVDILKRLGKRGQNERFFSTSHMAALPLLERLDRLPDHEKAISAFEGYLQRLEKAKASDEAFSEVPGEGLAVFGKYDGHLLFGERLHEYFDLNDLNPEYGKKYAQHALQEFFKKLEIPQPHPYYALLLADGDHMGKAIDRQTTADAHRKLSRRLASFAKGVRGIVESDRYKGKLVYSGGDDALAFLPLHTVLACAQQLATIFKDEFQTFKFQDGDGRERQPTLSVGVAVAHHLEPLNDTLEQARRAEKAAKKTRNALCVSVSKRSGAETSVSGTWTTETTHGMNLAERLETFADWYNRDELPAGAAYELRELANIKLPVEAEAKEVKRILGRKRTDGGGKSLREEVSNILIATLTGISLSQLADELVIAREFARAKDIAHGSATTQRGENDEQLVD